MIVGWWALAASAQDATCAAPYSKIQLGAAIGEISDALAVSDLADAEQHVQQVHDRLPCLDEVVDKHLFALFARYEAVVTFFSQQEDEAELWARASLLAEPDLGWDDKQFPPTHPLRKLFAEQTLPAPTSLQESGLLVPKGGGLFVSGTFVPRPTAYEDVPALVQVFDKGRARVDGYWQEGTRFLDRVLTNRVADVPPPAWLGTTAPPPHDVAVAPRPSPAPKPDPVVRPSPVPAPKPVPEPKPTHAGGGHVPVVPIAVAAGFALVSGGTYALAGTYAAQLPDAQNEAQLTKVRSNANLMVLVSGVSAVGAVGFGVGGIVLSGRF
jgi:hypothetical protein